MKKIAFIFLFCPLFIHAQVITTIAGIGPSGTSGGGFSGDGGPATAAKLFNPCGVAIDLYGNIYIAESQNHRIRKIDTTGTITTVAGNGTQGYTGDGGPATAAEISWPAGVAVDQSGNVYFSASNRFVRKVNAAGIISTFAGGDTTSPGYELGDGGPAVAAKLCAPIGVAVDQTGNVYIADSYGQRVRKVDTFGIISTFAGTGYGAGTASYGGYGGDGGPATAAELSGPTGVTTDVSGNVYIAEQGNCRVRKVNSAGIITTFAGSGIDSTTGFSGYSGNGGPATSAKFSGVTSVAVDNTGNVYITDYSNSVIRKVDNTGIVDVYAGSVGSGFSGDGGPAIFAKIALVYNIAFDRNNNLYLADGGNNRVRKIDTTHVLEVAKVRKNSTFNIYPDPTSAVLNISTSEKINSISIINFAGHIVYSGTSQEQQVQIDVAYLPAGIYVVKINGMDARKFVKQ